MQCHQPAACVKGCTVCPGLLLFILSFFSHLSVFVKFFERELLPHDFDPECKFC